MLCDGYFGPLNYSYYCYYENLFIFYIYLIHVTNCIHFNSEYENFSGKISFSFGNNADGPAMDVQC
jgi:hypothetical protein